MPPKQPTPPKPSEDKTNPLHHPFVEKAMKDAPPKQTTAAERNHDGRKPYKISPVKR